MKISELTVVDLRGACMQMERHLTETLQFEQAIAKAEVTADRVTMSVRVTGRGVADQYAEPNWIIRWETLDGDWDALLAETWAAIGKHVVPEVREIRSVMQKLGDAIEGIADSPSEFAITLRARLNALRDEAGARLITYQAAE